MKKILFTIFAISLFFASCSSGSSDSNSITAITTNSTKPNISNEKYGTMKIENEEIILNHYLYSNGRGYVYSKELYGGKLWSDANGTWHGQGQKTLYKGCNSGWSFGIYKPISMTVTESNYKKTEVCNYAGTGKFIENGTQETKATQWYLSPGTKVAGSISADFKTLKLKIDGYVQKADNAKEKKEIHVIYEGGGWQ